MRRTIAWFTNWTIRTLNRLYDPLHSPSTLPPSFVSQQPDISTRFTSPPFVYRLSAGCSSAQLRLVNRLRDDGAAFVLQARAWCVTTSASESDLQADALRRLLSSPHLFSFLDDSIPSPADDAAGAVADSTATVWPSTRLASIAPAHSLNDTPPLYSTFSTEPTPVVTLVAARVALPDSLHVVPMTSILPPPIALLYEQSESPLLLRPADEVAALNRTAPIRTPRVNGARTEYVELIRRLKQQGMVSFTSSPRAVNGVFTVAKDSESDRLIIDAQRANRLFLPSPHVALPNPSHLVQLQVPVGTQLFVGKSDLSNFYHHLGLPAWLQPFFALPALTADEQKSLGLPTDSPSTPCHPMCCTLPMGWSHAVYIANTGHEHVLYRDSVLCVENNLLRMSSPLVSHERVLHGVVIDDFFCFSLNEQLAKQEFQAVLGAYRRAGFIVKQSKVVWPTVETVKIIGFEVHGKVGKISLAMEGRLALLQATLALLQRGQITGLMLAQLVGRWTWCMLVRRCSLCLLQHVYRFISIAGRRRFILWPSVRRELKSLLGLLPLLQLDLHTPYFTRVIATDSSSFAAGVVSSPLTAELQDSLWPLCSSKRHAIMQTLHARDAKEAEIELTDAAAAIQLYSDSHSTPTSQLSEGGDLRQVAAAAYSSLYLQLHSLRWSTIVSKSWRAEEHINALELRACLLALHWALSFPSSLSRRIFLLVDSTVAFFSLWKGRSSSPQLLMILRKIHSLLLAGGISLSVGWLPSEINPADGPSRLQPIAIASHTSTRAPFQFLPK